MNYTRQFFDSEAEYKFYQRNQHLLDPCQDKYLPAKFKDSNGHTFNAKADFIYQDLIYIEFKCHQLNNMDTKEKADQRYQNQINQGYDPKYAELLYKWSHSQFKQGIVARHYAGNFLLVFKDGTKLSTQAINKMAAEQITWCYESHMLKILDEMVSELVTH